MTTGPRHPGEFCWINILTTQPAQAREFFSALLGWTYADMPGMGHLIKVGGHDVGGLFDLEGPNTPPGTPPMIGVMVKVENADAAGARVNELGGKAMPAFDIGQSGRMAVCFDPNGAQFDVWQPNKSPGTDVDTTMHGAPSWFETMTTDVPRATAFYSALFGWSPIVTPMPEFQYTTFMRGDQMAAGLMPMMPGMENVPSHWGTYFTVKDVEATARHAVELGGSLLVPVQPIENVGRFCGIASPQGVMFYAITYAR